MSGIFEVMGAESLDTLVFDYDYKKDRLIINAAALYGEETDFSEYKRSFSYLESLSENERHLNSTECRALLEKKGTGSELESIERAMRSGKHERLRLFYHRGLGLKIAAAEHNTVRGKNTRSHAITCGGIRRRLKDTSEHELIMDALNLSRAMSYKNVAAEIPFGGCKLVMQGEDCESDEALGFIAYAVDKTGAVVAPDMNLSPEISDKMAEKGYSAQFVGGNKSVTGATGRPTAYGVFLSMKEAVRFREGDGSLKGKHVLLMGLGNVGYALAEYLLSEGARLSVSDIDAGKIERFAAAHPESGIETVPVGEVLRYECDILSPCAMGGLFTPETIEGLKCSYIWGSANNQLVSGSKEEELALAELIAARGILYEAEWWHNTAGVMCMAEEYLNEATPEEVLRRVERIIPKSTAENLREAASAGITPAENCYRKCESVLFS